jgi:hypothetical protein
MKKFEIIEMSDGKLETVDVKYSPLTKGARGLFKLLNIHLNRP